MFEKILIPTDGSTPATNAARKGVEIAVAHDATVHVMSVVEPVPLGGLSAGPEPASTGHGEIIGEQEEQARNAIETVTKLCEDHGVDAVEALVYGKPSEEIIDYVDEEGINAIVMGTHGRSGAERLLIGSVAEKVVRQSPVPVMTIRQSE